MIKCTLPQMKISLIKLFNHVLHSEIFPQYWAEGHINPLLKSNGNKDDPANHRGITISSCLGKLFTSIMKDRFSSFLKDNNLVDVSQIGFSPGKRTSDHMFVLKTLMDCAKYQRYPLYLCFIDLKSAFDTVWTDGLLYKLTKLQASTRFIGLIKNMYSKLTARVKVTQGLTESFPVTVGTRQGCNLSPPLFNCYINELPRVLNDMSAKQPLLGDLKISCLLYADDLILISKSPDGLQQLITTTEQFCNKWQLTINTSKTKIMTSHKRNTDGFSWYIYGKAIDKVTSFCYLGLEIDCKGNFKKAIARLRGKAYSAYRSIRQEFNFHNGSSVAVMTRLFDTIVKPIMLYGSEIWGLHGWRKCEEICVKNYLFSKKSEPEKLHSIFCKQVLGIDKQVPDVMAKAELGRYPLMGNIITQCYGFWQHLLNSDKASLSYKALQVNIALDRLGHTTYYSRIKTLLAVLKEHHKIYPVPKTAIKNAKMEVLKTFCNKYETTFFSSLQDRRSQESQGKFDIFCKIKKNYKSEKYLSFVHSSKLRRIITGIRCACNPLPVNLLRKYGIKREERICHMCNSNEIGTELHLFMHCTNQTLSSIRNELLNKINTQLPHSKKLSPEQLFYYLLMFIEETIALQVAMYLDKIYKIVASPQT